MVVDCSCRFLIVVKSGEDQMTRTGQFWDVVLFKIVFSMYTSVKTP